MTKARCVHQRPWFRCGLCTGETEAATRDYSLTGAAAIEGWTTPLSRHLAAMRRENLEVACCVILFGSVTVGLSR